MITMKDTIYLVLSQYKVERMTKNPPATGRGELAVKVVVEARQSAFREPTLVREITVTDPMEGIGLDDIELTQPYITEEEAAMIRARRLENMAEQLRSRGYAVLRAPDMDKGGPDGTEE
jgi:hypothetical protein